MKKTSKMFGAVALSATLALGMAAPAFATSPLGDPSDVTGVGTDGDITNTNADGSFKDPNNKYEATGETVVQINATNTQINATVPVTIGVYAKTAGGELLTPHEYAYTLTNNSEEGKLYVVGVQAEMLGIDKSKTDALQTVPWTSAAATSLGAASSGAIGTAISNTVTTGSDSIVYTPKYGSVYVQLTAGLLTDTFNAKDDDLQALKDLDGKPFKDHQYIDNKAQQTIPLMADKKLSTSVVKTNFEVDKKAKSDAAKQNQNVLGLRIEGFNSQLSSTSEIMDQMTNLMKITYTVQASARYANDYDMRWTPADGTNFNYADVIDNA